jgi:16S rRNA (cytosine967-C5)-methyltransferase
VEPAVRHAVLRGLAAILTKGARAEGVVAQTLRQHPRWDNATRKAVSRQIYGVACMRARLCHLLDGVGLAPQDEAHLLAAYLHDQEGMTAQDAAAGAGLAEETADALATAKSVCWPADAARRLAVQRSLPPAMAQQWCDLLGPAEADLLAAALNTPGPLTLRVNTLRTSRDNLMEQLTGLDVKAECGRWSPWRTASPTSPPT